MENLVIKPKNKAELKFLSDLLKKLSMDFRIKIGRASCRERV